MINVFMDDIRHGPDVGNWKDGVEDWMDWIIVRSVENTKKLLTLGIVNNMSLDHDMGSEITGYDLVCWMEKENIWPNGWIQIHSANPVGAEKMRACLKANGKL